MNGDEVAKISGNAHQPETVPWLVNALHIPTDAWKAARSGFLPMLTEYEAGHYIRPTESCGISREHDTQRRMKKSIAASQEKKAGSTVDRCYRSYNSGGDLEFCPLKDLNLPESYEEVLARFEKLQGERAMEVLN